MAPSVAEKDRQFHGADGPPVVASAGNVAPDVPYPAALFGEGAIDWGGLEEVREDLRGEGDEESAVATVDEDLREGEHGAFDVDRKGFSGAEGRGTTDLVAGLALRDFGLAGFDGFCADLTGEIFEADLAITVHEDDEGVSVLILHDKGLDDVMLVGVELTGGCGGAAMLDILVEILGEGDVVLAEECGGGSFGGVGFAGHGFEWSV